MVVKEHDVVKLKDGRKGTVIDVYEGHHFLIETESRDMNDWPTVGIDEIEEVVYVHKITD